VHQHQPPTKTTNQDTYPNPTYTYTKA
jgi:hypothetical protein